VEECSRTSISVPLARLGQPFEVEGGRWHE